MQNIKTKYHFYIIFSCIGLNLLTVVISKLFQSNPPILPIVGIMTAAIIVFGVRAFPAIIVGNALSSLISQYLLSNGTTTISHEVLNNSLYLIHMLCVLALSTRFKNKDTINQSKLSECVKTFVWALLIPCTIIPTLLMAIQLASSTDQPLELQLWFINYGQGLLGGMITMPLAILMFAQGRKSLQRIKMFAIPVSILLAVCVYIFHVTLNIENTTLRNTVQDKSVSINSTLEQRLQSYRSTLRSLAIYIEANPSMEPNEFNFYTERNLKDDPDIFGLSFNPIVTELTRETWEDKINAYYHRNDIYIKERSANGLIKSPTQDYYVPVGFISPLEPNKAAIGFNIFSNQERRDAILFALANKVTSITAPIKLVQENQQRMGALAMEPIFNEDRQIVGLAVAVLKIDDIINRLLTKELKENFVISINDNNPSYRDLTYFKNEITAELNHQFTSSHSMKVFNRDWQIELVPSQAFINANRSNFALTTTMMAFLIAGIIQFILLNASSAHQQNQLEINEKTLLLNTQKNILTLNMARLEKISAEKEQLLNTAQATLRELQTRRTQQEKLFAIIGHELRTPVAMLKMMLIDQNVAKLEPFGQKIIDTIDHTLNVLDDMHAVVNPQNHVKKIAPANPKQILADTIAGLDFLIQEHNIDVVLNADKTADQLYSFDRYSFTRLMLNLIKNAIIHSQGSKIWVNITPCNVDADKSCFDIFIDDDGVGIAEAHQANIFSEFYRGDTQADGSGLGLSICKTIVDNLNGTISYETSSFGGARFAIRLSFNNNVIDLPAKDNASVRHTFILEGTHVLVAEDQFVIRTITEKWLKQHGAIVVSAEDGQQALEAFEKQHFDIVITDIMMPNLDGYQLTEVLRAKGYEGLIIGTTAASIGEETQKLIQLGANAAIPKPLDIHSLKNTLKELKA